MEERIDVPVVPYEAFDGHSAFDLIHTISGPMKERRVRLKVNYGDFARCSKADVTAEMVKEKTSTACAVVPLPEDRPDLRLHPAGNCGMARKHVDLICI